MGIYKGTYGSIFTREVLEGIAKLIYNPPCVVRLQDVLLAAAWLIFCAR